MHKLENDILNLAERIARDYPRQRALARRLRVLASTSHNYLWDEEVPGNPDGRDEEGREE